MIDQSPAPHSTSTSPSSDRHGAQRPARNLAPGQAAAGQGTRLPLLGRRIIFVDDNPDLVAVCARLLGGHGAEVIGTCSHREAFSILWEDAADAVVSNLGEDGAGFELIERIRTADDPQVASVPAIALSGFDHTEVIEQAFAHGYDLFLPKPVALTELVSALGSVIRPE